MCDEKLLANERIDLKTTQYAKEILKRAACISGHSSLTSFVLQAAIEKAREVILFHQQIDITQIEIEKFSDAIELVDNKMSKKQND